MQPERDINCAIVIVPPGTYYIGDPAYAFEFEDREWYNVCELLENRAEGQIVFKLNGKDFFIMFDKSSGHVIGPNKLKYSEIFTDSGIIGLIPKELWAPGTRNKDLEELGLVIEVKKPTVFKKIHDIILFANYTIDTSEFQVSLFDGYDHKRDAPIGDVVDGERVQGEYNIWGEYDEEQMVITEGVKMGEDFWKSIDFREGK